jgi:hypothetical protein
MLDAVALFSSTRCRPRLFETTVVFFICLTAFPWESIFSKKDSKPGLETPIKVRVLHMDFHGEVEPFDLSEIPIGNLTLPTTIIIFRGAFRHK